MQRSLRSSERVAPEEFSQRISSKLGESAGVPEVRHGQVWLSVAKDRLIEVVRGLKSEPDLALDYLTFLSAVDWQEEGTELVIVLFSTSKGVTVGIKVAMAKDDDNVPSITGVFQGANWHERECAEMFGLTFDGHPSLRKLYLPDDFEGHPLRKSFKLASRTYKPWPGAKDPDEASSGGR